MNLMGARPAVILHRACCFSLFEGAASGLETACLQLSSGPIPEGGISSPSSLPSAPRSRISCKCSALPPLLTLPPRPFSSILEKLTLARTPLSYSDAAGNETSPALPRTIPLHNHQPRAEETGCSLTQISHPEIEHLRAARAPPLSQNQSSPSVHRAAAPETASSHFQLGSPLSGGPQKQ